MSGGPAVAFVDIDAINIPLRREHISEQGLSDLAKTIKGGWLRHPIVLTPEHLLLDGERRLRAAKLAGNTKIQAYICDTLQQASDVMAAALADPEYRIPMTYTEIGRTVDLLLQWSAPQRLERKREVARRAVGARLGTTKAQGRATPNSGDYIAAAVGVSGGSLGRLKQIWQMVKSDDPELAGRAKQAMKLIDETGTITTYLGILKTGRAISTAKVERTLPRSRQRTAMPRVEQITDPREQRKVLTNAAQALSGINIGLAQVAGVTSTTLNEAELAQLRDTLSTTGRLTRIILRQLAAGTDNQGGKN